MPIANEMPRLVTTNRGFSVYYNNRYLFSKYDPQKAFSTVVNNTEILENSLIICVSPVLQFPIEIISEKLKNCSIENCFILAIEANPDLYDFYCNNNLLDLDNVAIAKISTDFDIAFLLENKNNKIATFGAKIPQLSQFKRLVVFEASSEVNVNRELFRVCTKFTNTILEK